MPPSRYGESTLGKEETAQLLEWGRVTARSEPSGLCVHDLFADQVAAHPEAPAVRSGKRVLSYRELDQRAGRIARVLRERGVGPDVCVGVCVERSVESVVAMLGVIKAGGCYLPLDPTYPPDRLSFMLIDSSAALLLTTARERGRIAGWDDSTVLIDEVGGVSSGAVPRADLSAGNLAYIMYTSGSTGIPKGVAVPHEAIVRLVRDTNYISFDPCDRVAHVSNLSFDAATFEIWGALLNGSELIVLNQDEVLEPVKLAARLRDYRISVLFLTPVVFSSTLREVPDAFKPLHSLLVGGGPLDPSAAREALRSGAPDRLLNAYGPTENTVFTTAHVVASVPPDASSVPIGQPVTGSYVYVLDERQRLVPAGVRGELYTGGLGLARGYVGKSELTKERFVPDPFGPPGSRIYRTGDVVRWLPGGVLEFLGRQDDQVKLRGYRIELGEIQARLAACEGVGAAVVTLRADDGEEPRIVAYVVPARGEQQPEASQLRAMLARWLPGYMLPAAFVIIPEIPLTAVGKVNYAQLPAPGEQREHEGSTAPLPGAEAAAAAVWSVILKVPHPRAEDDFFDLGGDSLQATRIVARLRQEFDVILQVRDLFDHPTVRGLAAVITARLDGADPRQDRSAREA